MHVTKTFQNREISAYVLCPEKQCLGVSRRILRKLLLSRR